MKRCYAMRKALALLDFASETIADVKRLLLRAAFLPAFLRISEGRKFLAYLFTLEACRSIAPALIQLKASLVLSARAQPTMHEALVVRCWQWLLLSISECW